MRSLYTIGIDEAGRGALAGPVVVAAVAVPKGFNHRIKSLPKLKDSKQLSYTAREKWHAYLKDNPLVFVSTARIYQKRIDKDNVSSSANVAASRALQRVLDELRLKEDAVDILLDGNLYLGEKRHANLKTKTIIKGDEKIVSIKLASIVAKVTRDKYMEKLHYRYPEYNLKQHKGYGTKEHFKALRKHGISPIHRLTYLKRYPNLKLVKH